MARNGWKSALAAALAALLLAPAASAVDLDDQDRAALASGKSVRKRLPTSGRDGFFGGVGFTLVDAPPEAVWAAIEDWGSYHEIYPKTAAVTEVSRKGDLSLVHVEMGHALVRAEYYVTVERDRQNRMISFRLVKSRPHDIDDARGYWRLFPQAGGRTLVAYVVAAWVPMGIINLLPPGLTSQIERHLLGVPKDLKTWIEGPNGSRYRTAAPE